MKIALLNRLQCPKCQTGELRLTATQKLDDEIVEGELNCVTCEQIYPIVRSIPRFVESENYASNFGFQWNRFRQTQLDSYSGTTISRDRFISQTAWTPEMLANSAVLEAGCGAGRFTEVALEMGAEVFAFDYSTAVDACWLNHAANPRLHVWQGDIYKIPLKLHQFDFVFCFGVLQHTPDVHGSFLSLLTLVKPGGQLVIDVYPKSWRCYLWIKYWLRPLTKCIPPEKLFSSVEKWVPILLPVSRALARVPRVGRQLRHLLPIANYEGMYPLTEQQLKECAVLDTYDMLAPQFDSPQTESTILAWFKEAGLENVNVFKRGQVVGRGTRQQNGRIF